MNSKKYPHLREAHLVIKTLEKYPFPGDSKLTPEYLLKFPPETWYLLLSNYRVKLNGARPQFGHGSILNWLYTQKYDPSKIKFLVDLSDE